MPGGPLEPQLNEIVAKGISGEASEILCTVDIKFGGCSQRAPAQLVQMVSAADPIQIDRCISRKTTNFCNWIAIGLRAELNLEVLAARWGCQELFNATGILTIP